MMDPGLARLARYLAGAAFAAPPELGAIAWFLSVAVNSRRRATGSRVVRAFRSGVTRMPGHLWLTSATTSAAITHIARTYRNPAAHTAVMSRAQFEDCWELVTGPQGLLWGLADATRSS